MIDVGDMRRELGVFKYITRSTHLRPRDYIKYLQACADQQLIMGGGKINNSTVKKVDKAFSNYLRSEIVDEAQALIPDVNEVLNILSEIRKQTFSQDLFRQVYTKRMQAGNLHVKDPDLVLRILFHFSVIGNQPKQKNVQVFYYLNKEARLNPNEQVVVHRGLFKSLQIV